MNTRFALTYMILVFSLLFLFISNGTGQQPAADADHFPIGLGNKWYYRKEVGNKNITIIDEVVKTQLVGGDTIAWVASYPLARDYFLPTERIRIGKSGVSLEQRGDHEYTPGLRMFAYPLRAGESWESQSTYSKLNVKFKARIRVIREDELVKVPAGTFQTVRVETERESEAQPPIRAVKTSFTSWLARGVGLVKYVGTIEGDVETTELLKYEIQGKVPKGQ